MLYNNELANFNNSIIYDKRAAAIFSSVTSGDSFGLALIYDNLAGTYIANNQADSALHYAQLSNEINLRLGNHYIQASILSHLARIYEKLKDNLLAETYYKKAIDYGKEWHILGSLEDAAKGYSIFLFNKNNYGEARYYGLMALNAAKQTSYKKGIIDNAETLRRIYDSLQQKDSAYYFSTIEITYRDSVFNDQKNYQLQNLIFDEQLKEKEDAAKKIESDKERRHNLEYAAVAFGVIVFIILFLALSHSIIINEKWIRFMGILALLVVFEFINLFIHPYLAHATNDSPFLMLLALVLIAALLIPAHHRLEKWITQRLIEKNKKIRLDAAKKTIAKLEG